MTVKKHKLFSYLNKKTQAEVHGLEIKENSFLKKHKLQDTFRTSVIDSRYPF